MLVKATIFCFLMSTLPQVNFSFKFKKAKEIHIYKKSPHRFFHHHHHHHLNGNRPNFVPTEIPVIPFINTAKENVEITENSVIPQVSEIPTENSVLVSDVPTNPPQSSTHTTILDTTLQNELEEIPTTTPSPVDEIIYTYEVTERIPDDITTPQNLFGPTKTATTTTTESTTNTTTTTNTEIIHQTNASDCNTTTSITTVDVDTTTPTPTTTTTIAPQHVQETTKRPKLTRIRIILKTHPDDENDNYVYDHDNDFDNKHANQHQHTHDNNFELNQNVDPAINDLFRNYVDSKKHDQQHTTKNPVIHSHHVENGKEISHVEYNIYKEDHSVRNHDHNYHHDHNHHDYYKYEEPTTFHQHIPHSDSYLKIWTK